METITFEHLHLIPARDGDFVCVDLTRLQDGSIWAISTFSVRNWNVSKEFGFRKVA